MNQRFALVFLVLLRMAIGLHFLIEGYEKYRSITVIGPTDTNRPWSSEGFFREGTGPMAKLVRWQIGDTDDMALARLTVGEGSPKRMPEALEHEWDQYFSR